MQGKGVEGFLLAALDRESDPIIASHLRASLRTLLAAGAGKSAVHITPAPNLPVCCL